MSIPVELENLREAQGRFNRVCLEKLISKADRGFEGWDCDNIEGKLVNDMWKHFRKLAMGDVSQAPDVANYAMFLWNLQDGES